MKKIIALTAMLFAASAFAFQSHPYPHHPTDGGNEFQSDDEDGAAVEEAVINVKLQSNMDGVYVCGVTLDGALYASFEKDFYLSFTERDRATLGNEKTVITDCGDFHTFNRNREIVDIQVHVPNFSNGLSYGIEWCRDGMNVNDYLVETSFQNPDSYYSDNSGVKVRDYDLRGGDNFAAGGIVADERAFVMHKLRPDETTMIFNLDFQAK